MSKDVYEGTVEVLGGYPEMPTEIWIGDDDITEILKQYQDQKIKIIIEKE